MIEYLLHLAAILPDLGKVNIGWVILGVMFMGQFWFEIKEG